MELLPGEHLIKNFNLQGKEFTFNFTCDTCEKIATGVCAIDKLNKNTFNYKFRRDREKYSRCQNIYFGLKSGQINHNTSLPYVCLCECGHYECIDGQHRICVAQRCNFKLDIVLEAGIVDPCEKCCREK